MAFVISVFHRIVLLAKRVVQIFKKGFKKQSEGTVQDTSYLLIALLLKHPLEYLHMSC